MLTDSISFRIATPSDALALLKIYGPYVTDTAITFEYTIPSEAEFASRIAHTLLKFPYLVAEYEGEIIGYGYASSLKERAAYNHCVELSIYLAPSCQGKGVGKRLYLLLEAILKAQGILNLYACIASPSREDDPHLTLASQHFHEYMGYRLVGHFYNCGYKFDTWYHMVWMEKVIGSYTAAPTFIPFEDAMLYEALC